MTTPDPSATPPWAPMKIRPRKLMTAQKDIKNTSDPYRYIPQWYTGPVGFSSPAAPLRIQPRKMNPEQVGTGDLPSYPSGQGSVPETASGVDWSMDCTDEWSNTVCDCGCDLKNVLLKEQSVEIPPAVNPVETVDGCVLMKADNPLKEKKERAVSRAPLTTLEEEVEKMELGEPDTDHETVEEMEVTRVSVLSINSALNSI